MRFAKRLDAVPPYLFAELERKVAEASAQGVDVISLGIGDPDLPTPPAVVEALGRGGARPAHAPVPVEPRHRASSARRRPTSTATASASSSTRTEVIPALGGKEGIGHIASPSSTRATSRSRPTPATRLHLGPRLRGRRGALPAAARGERLPARPRGDPAEVPRARTCSSSTTRTTRPARSCRAASSSGPSSSPAARPDRRPRQRLLGGHLRRLPRAELPRDAGREGGRRRGLLALEGLEHDRLALPALVAGNAEVVERYWQLKTNIDSGMFEAVQLRRRSR